MMRESSLWVAIMMGLVSPSYAGERRGLSLSCRAAAYEAMGRGRLAAVEALSAGPAKNHARQLLFAADAKERSAAGWHLADSYRGGPALVRVLRYALDDADPTTRQAATYALFRFKTPVVVSLLTRSLFDLSRIVREQAATQFFERGQLRQAVDLINKRYPRDALGRLPAAYFFSQFVFPIPSEPTTIENENAHERAVRMGQRVQQRYRGLPVVLGEDSSHHEDGILYIDAREPPEFREGTMAHEFGETWSHQIGNALQMIELNRVSGRLQRYLDYVTPFEGKQTKRAEFRRIVAAEPGGFADFRSFLE